MYNVKRKPNGFFPAFDFGEFKVSIQASETHYCNPKIKLDWLASYHSVEVRVDFDLKHKNHSTACYLKEMLGVSYDFREPTPEPVKVVAGWVTKKQLRELFAFMLSVSPQEE